MEPDVFAMAFGTEFFIEPGRVAGMREGWFLAEEGLGQTG